LTHQSLFYRNGHGVVKRKSHGFPVYYAEDIARRSDRAKESLREEL
jgi:hypothetical protein